MEKKYKFGVIGAGFMATAIVNGALSSKVLSSSEIIVSDVNIDALNKMSKIGVSVTQNNGLLIEQSEYVLFAVKPQSLSNVLADVASNNDCKFISIMAGVKKEKIKKAFPNAKVARCMPNTPCSISSGAIGVDLSDYSDEDDITFVKNLLGSLAAVVSVSEDKLNAVTGVSGSSPAYFYLFLKGVIDAGIKHGLTESEAKILATNTMIGAGKMVLNNPDKSLDELINAVCSKGGTTIEAVKVYNENNLSTITKKAIDACVKRSEELENL